MTIFDSTLSQADPAVAQAIAHEYERQRDGIEMIASENIVSRAVMQAQGSVMTNKYAEGYPGRRYYGGCAYVDDVERLAQERAKQLFNCAFANVQPHSGSQANQAVYLSLLKPGDKILGMALDQGGHLTHGSPVNMSGKWFEAHSYGITAEGLIDYDDLLTQAQKVQPRLIIAGYSAYPRQLDFAKFRKVADEVGALLMADIAHFAGLVVTGAHPSPFPHVDVATTTTHKTLRGPRGGMILTNDADMAKKINSAIFPGLQGGPLMHVIAAKAVAFGEALQPAYKQYMEDVVTNARVLGDTLMKQGFELVANGTDNHLVLLDLHKQGLTGKEAEAVLEEAGLTTNKNAVPNDPQPPTKTSGVRLGSPAATSRGMKAAEFEQIGLWIAEILTAMAAKGDVTGTCQRIRQEVRHMCARFPIYPEQVMREAA
jgi:glycine hydroxymethyltransferase